MFNREEQLLAVDMKPMNSSLFWSIPALYRLSVKFTLDEIYSLVNLALSHWKTQDRYSNWSLANLHFYPVNSNFNLQSQCSAGWTNF